MYYQTSAKKKRGRSGYENSTTVLYTEKVSLLLPRLTQKEQRDFHIHIICIFAHTSTGMLHKSTGRVNPVMQ